MKKTYAAAVALAAAFTATGAQAAAGDVLVRLRGIVVAPNEDSGDISGLAGQQVSVNNDVVPEIDFTYMATDQIGFELIAATSKHTVSGKTGVTGSIGALASSYVLPPTLTVQYHPIAEGPIRPYVGAGINYTFFYNDKATSGFEAAAGSTTVHLKDSVGWALQAGVDIDLNKKLFFNLDVKYIDMDTTARLTTTALGVRTVKVDLNPFVFGAGIGMRF